MVQGLFLAFSSLQLHPSLLRALRDLGFARPTAIQTDAIPPALDGRDLLASAQTGSGKTAAFLLPIVHRLIDKPRGVTRALVLAPTRELAAQILADLQDLAVHTPVTGAAVFGGVSHAPQEHAFRSGVDVVIATPGRLLDHLRAPYARLGQLEWLVLDEADRMLDMGFLPEIRRILRHLPARRQTLCFSATMPPPIRTLTGEMLHQPVVIERARATVTPAAIAQAVYPIAQDLKSALLLALLRRGDIRQALVFTRTKHRANRLADVLVRGGVRAGRIHGNRSQAQRTAALATFRSGATPVLVATDIAARGIDVEDLAHVVNFDVPVVAEDYIHRIGRTGRADASGEAFTFMAPEERAALAAIERAIGRPLPRVTLPDFDYAARPAGRLEIPIAERLAALRAQKAVARARAAGATGQAGRPGPAAPQGARKRSGRARGRRSMQTDRPGGAPRPGAPAPPRRLDGDGPSPTHQRRRRRFRPRRRR